MVTFNVKVKVSKLAPEPRKKLCKEDFIWLKVTYERAFEVS